MRAERDGKARPGRMLYLDFVRGLAVFFMVMQHAFIMYERTV